MAILRLNFCIAIITSVSLSLPLLSSASLAQVTITQADAYVEFLDMGYDGVNNKVKIVGHDFNNFIGVLSSQEFQVEADIDENGVVNFLDIAPFIGILSAN